MSHFLIIRIFLSLDDLIKHFLHKRCGNSASTSGFNWLVIFRMYGNIFSKFQIFQTPASLFEPVRVPVLAHIFLWKIFLGNMKQMISCSFSKEFFFSQFLTGEKSKSKYLREETIVFVKPVFINSNKNLRIVIKI